jgi:hypothetical protein
MLAGMRDGQWWITYTPKQTGEQSTYALAKYGGRGYAVSVGFVINSAGTQVKITSASMLVRDDGFVLRDGSALVGETIGVVGK